MSKLATHVPSARNRPAVEDEAPLEAIIEVVEPDPILSLPVEQSDIDTEEPITIGAYLAEIFVALLVEGEGFSGKRPLGNSDWESAITDALGTDDLTELQASIRKALA